MMTNQPPYIPNTEPIFPTKYGVDVKYTVIKQLIEMLLMMF